MREPGATVVSTMEKELRSLHALCASLIDLTRADTVAVINTGATLVLEGDPTDWSAVTRTLHHGGSQGQWGIDGGSVLEIPLASVAPAWLVVRTFGAPFSVDEVRAIEGLAEGVRLAMEQPEVDRVLAVRQDLNTMVGAMAGRLMGARLESRVATLNWIVAELGRHLGSDVVFLRRQDSERRLTILEAEWPIRNWVGPGEDPLGVVPFDADPVFTVLENLKRPYFAGLDDTGGGDYLERVETATGGGEIAPGVVGVAVPLLSGDETWGVLGFLHFTPHVWTRDEVNAAQAVAGLVLQLERRFEAERALTWESTHDPLTGLANRRGLLRAMEERAESTFGVVMFDLDRFKVVNDYYGHAEGDGLLVQVAQRVRNLIREGDVAGRLGGDEFVIVTTAGGHDESGVEALVQRLVGLGEVGIPVAGTPVQVTISVGYTVSRPGEVALETLRRADTAMYAAKRSGRNQVRRYDEVMAQDLNRRSQTELDFVRGLEDHEFFLLYQPEVDLASGEILGVEALIRWRHPERGLLAPDEFIPVAEETGMIVDLTRWVVDEATRQLAAWNLDEARDFTLRLNCSEIDLRLGDLPERIRASAERWGTDPRRICIEVTERTEARDVTEAMASLAKVREAGTKVAIDDFGTGYASMTELRWIPADVLKIDISFVRGLSDDPFNEAIVNSILTLARALGLGVVAEGVEDEITRDALLAMGCTRGQGYFFHRPLPADRVGELLALVPA